MEGYIEKDKRKKFILISDDLRGASGVGNVSRDIVVGTAHKYNWFQIGGTRTTSDQGKIIDVSDDINKKTGLTDSNVKLISIEGFGNIQLLRQIIKQENADGIFLITDPRYFEWLFSAENEIRKEIPIFYLNIWDELPVPLYNLPYYESCDALMSISKQTKNINRLTLQHGDVAYKDLDTNETHEGKSRSCPVVLKYVPHGIDIDIFKPLDATSPELLDFKKQALGGNEYDFVAFFNSRNMRRKQIPDIILAWKLFLDTLDAEKKDKCVLILHTAPVDENGTDLLAVIEYLFGENTKNIKISSQRLAPEHLNMFYNLADIQVLISSNEGWGLSLTEAIATGTPILANVQGGMQDQMRFVDDEGKWLDFSDKVPSNHNKTYQNCGSWVFPVWPSCKSLQGSPPTPYIWDSRADVKDVAEQFEIAYNCGREELKKVGNEGREWLLSDEAGLTKDKMCERIIETIDYTLNDWKPRETTELIDASTIKTRTVNHNLVY
jgi:glycosyltransferase involved in cell wall biosynthesis